jgi:hypothetical protein
MRPQFVEINLSKLSIQVRDDPGADVAYLRGYDSEGNAVTIDKESIERRSLSKNAA